MFRPADHILIIFGALKIKPLKKFENHNSLNRRNVNFTKNPYVTHDDLFWLRKVFLEKVRNAYSYDDDEFNNLPPEILYNLVNNKELYDFFTYYMNFPSTLNYYYLAHIVELINHWQPSEPSDDLDDKIRGCGIGDYFNSENNAIEFELLENPGSEPESYIVVPINEPDDHEGGVDTDVD